MRLRITFEGGGFVPFSKVSKHTIQGVIYTALQDTDLSDMHCEKGFKYFTFSDIFPARDFFPGQKRHLLISSPNPNFINTLYNQIRKWEILYLSDEPFRIKEVKKFKLPPHNRFITGSPVVLYKDNRTGEYFSFRKKDDVATFLKRITENAVKKYNQYYGDELELEGPIFDEVVFNKEVAVRVARQGKEFIIIGSMWYELARFVLKRNERKFYHFIMDCGIGEKNSLGFGFLNPIKQR